MGTESARRALKSRDTQDGEPERSAASPRQAETDSAPDRLPILRAAGRLAAAQHQILSVGVDVLSDGLAVRGPLDVSQIVPQLARRTLQVQEIASTTALSVAHEVVRDATGGSQALVRELTGMTGARFVGPHSWDLARAGADLFVASFEALVLCPITAARELLTQLNQVQPAEQG